jgi:formamidopyrimidine-DNA glycosylase
MPELPEIEVLSRELGKKISGLRVSEVVICREFLLKTPRKILEKKLLGKTVLKLSRRGKYLCLIFDSELILWLHLGMTGQLLWASSRSYDAYAQMALRFENSAEELIFRDIRKFGRICLTNGSPDSMPRGLRELGPEPLELAPDDFTKCFDGRTGRIKSLLLNQKLVAGLGNIYADESLFRAGINPRKRPSGIKREKFLGLHKAVYETLREAILQGGSSIDDFIHTDGSRGGFQNFHRVYGRAGEKCFNCGTIIRRIMLGGRSAHFCPTCQK